MRLLKVIQINIYKGRYLEALIEFLKGQNPDFITMQEVTSGGFNLYGDKNADIFEILKSRLKMAGAFHKDLHLKGEKNASLGNAVLSKFKIIKQKVITLKKFRPVTLVELDGSARFDIRPLIDRHLLEAILEFDRDRLRLISVHGAWSAPPTDSAQTLRQAQIIADYLKSLADQPFVMGGDLNMPPGTEVINLISKVAHNLMENLEVEGTLNPRIHQIAPRNFLVDYIFCSRHFKVKSLKISPLTVSDHLPVIAELEL